jgi:hypothetical protein
MTHEKVFSNQNNKKKTEGTARVETDKTQSPSQQSVVSSP